MDTRLTAEPKRRNAARTRAAILAAAQNAFTAKGYAQAGIRDIAALADINFALVLRYFGTKEQLFEAALGQALNVESLLTDDRGQFGAHVAGLLAMETPAVDPTSMMVLSTASPDSRAVTIDLLEKQIIAPLAAWLGPPDAEQRAAMITVLCTGFVTFSRLLPLNGLLSDDRQVAVDWLARSLQEVVDRS